MQPIATNFVAWSVCLSVTLVYSAKTTELTEMLFGMLDRVGPSNHVLYRVQIPQGKKQFWQWAYTGMYKTMWPFVEILRCLVHIAFDKV